MTVEEFVKKLEAAVGHLPDTDGEPGYFAAATGWNLNSDGSRMVQFVITDADLPQEMFEVTVKKVG